MIPPRSRLNIHNDDDFEAASLVEMTALEPPTTLDAGPLGHLPVLSGRQVRIGSRLGSNGRVGQLREAIAALPEALGAHIQVQHFEVAWRAAGLARPGAVAQWAWPRYSTRIGLGIETSLAHAVVDHLLGYGRLPAEGRLQVTPVEWGILTYLVTRVLSRLDHQPGALGPFDLVLDRVGPDPFDARDLGPIATLLWSLRVGRTTGTLRFWVPEVLIEQWLAADPPPTSTEFRNVQRFFDLETSWRAEAGTIELPRGVSRLRLGVVLPLTGVRLAGSLDRLSGEVLLASHARDAHYQFQTHLDPESRGARLVLMSRLQKTQRPRETLAVSSATPSSSSDSNASTVAPTDVPVTLVVELGRLNLPLRRLADLRPGDVLELSRHAREPVELTSGGRLIARGELVQIDTELGLRVTNVFL